MRVLWIILLTVGGLYVGVCVLLYLLQSRLVHLPFIPGRQHMATPDQVGLLYESVYIVTSDQLKIHGWFIPAPNATKTLLMLHGNAGNISHRLDALLTFHRLGLNILIIDYRGYGLSEGHPSEAGLYQDAAAAFRYLQDERGIAAEDIIVFGHSLGGSVAAWLAARQSPGALIVESSFTSAEDMAAEMYWFLPARRLTRLGYKTLENIENITCPVLIIHSRDDEVAPFHHGQQLFAAAPQPKRFLVLRGGHDTAFLDSSELYIEGVQDFLHSLPAAKSRALPAASPGP